MTLIAGFFKDGCPILIGDILLSNTDKSNKELVFPSIGKISNEHLSKGEYKPTSFCQKVNLLSPRLAIAWAGREYYAKSFMQEVISANLHNNPSQSSLGEIFDRIGKGKISVIGLYRNEKEMRLFDFDAISIDPPVPNFEWFKAKGSGYSLISNIAQNLGNRVIFSGQPNKLHIGISVAAQIIMGLLSKEILTFLPLQNMFGAGYEILHPLGEGLAKFSGLTYLFWRAEEEKSGNWKIAYPFLVSNYSYYKDILVIRSVRMLYKTSNNCKIDSDEVHFVFPIYRPTREEEIIGCKPPSLNSEYMMNVFLCKDYNGTLGAFAHYGRYTGHVPPIIFTNEFKSNEGIKIDEQFVKSFIQRIAMYSKRDK